jgi:hypothetical protein
MAVPFCVIRDPHPPALWCFAGNRIGLGRTAQITWRSGNRRSLVASLAPALEDQNPWQADQRCLFVNVLRAGASHGNRRLAHMSKVPNDRVLSRINQSATSSARGTAADADSPDHLYFFAGISKQTLKRATNTPRSKDLRRISFGLKGRNMLGGCQLLDRHTFEIGAHVEAHDRCAMPVLKVRRESAIVTTTSLLSCKCKRFSVSPAARADF